MAPATACAIAGASVSFRNIATMADASKIISVIPFRHITIPRDRYFYRALSSGRHIPHRFLKVVLLVPSLVRPDPAATVLEQPVPPPLSCFRLSASPTREPNGGSFRF